MDAVTEELKSTLDRVGEWLRYAEAKNGAIATLDLAVVAGCIAFYVEIDCPHVALTIYIFLVIFFLISSAFFSLISFLPRTTLHPSSGLEGALTTGNVFYFGDIARMGSVVFLSEFIRKSGLTVKASEGHTDLAQQIVINSKIAIMKFACSQKAVWLAVSALGTPLITLFFYWRSRRETL